MLLKMSVRIHTISKSIVDWERIHVLTALKFMVITAEEEVCVNYCRCAAHTRTHAHARTNTRTHTTLSHTVPPSKREQPTQATHLLEHSDRKHECVVVNWRRYCLGELQMKQCQWLLDSGWHCCC